MNSFYQKGTTEGPFLSKLLKDTTDFSNPDVHSIFTLLLMKPFFEKNKSSRATSESRVQFLPRITPVPPELYMLFQEFVAFNISTCSMFFKHTYKMFHTNTSIGDDDKYL